MSQKLTPFEDKLKQLLDTSSDSPPQFIWANVENSISNKNNPFINKWPWIIAFCLLSTIVTYSIFKINTTATKKNTTTATTTLPTNNVSTETINTYTNNVTTAPVKKNNFRNTVSNNKVNATALFNINTPTVDNITANNMASKVALNNGEKKNNINNYALLLQPLSFLKANTINLNYSLPNISSFLLNNNSITVWPKEQKKKESKASNYYRIGFTYGQQHVTYTVWNKNLIASNKENATGKLQNHTYNLYIQKQISKKIFATIGYTLDNTNIQFNGDVAVARKDYLAFKQGKLVPIGQLDSFNCNDYYVLKGAQISTVFQQHNIQIGAGADLWKNNTFAVGIDLQLQQNVYTVTKNSTFKVVAAPTDVKEYYKRGAIGLGLHMRLALYKSIYLVTEPMWYNTYNTGSISNTNSIIVPIGVGIELK